MLETVMGVGISPVSIIQVAIFFQTRILNSKIDKMVTESQCEERRKECKGNICKMEHNLGHHVHNGSGVKFYPKD